MGASSFKIVTKQQPRTPHTLVMDYKSLSPIAQKMAKGWKEELDITQAFFVKATKKMKKCADAKRRPLEYEAGNLVLVKILSHQTQK